MSGVRAYEGLGFRLARYRKGDVVEMTAIRNGARAKAVFTVHAVVYHPDGWHEYQLMDISTGQLYKRGAGVREKDLKPGKNSIGTNATMDPLVQRVMEQTEKEHWSDFSSKKANKKTEKESGAIRSPYDSGPAQLDTPSTATPEIVTEFDSKPLEDAISAVGVRSFVDSGYATENRKSSQTSALAATNIDLGNIGNDTASIYSNQSSAASSYNETYIAEIAADISEHIPTEVLSSESSSLERLYERLPRLLKGFAIQLADSIRTQGSRDAMVFISQHRHAIVTQVKRLAESESTRDVSANWTVHEKICHWRDSVDNTANNPEEVFVGVNDLPDATDETKDEAELGKLPRYREIVKNGPAHKWFINHVEQELLTYRPEPDLGPSIADTILSEMSALGSFRAISRSKNPEHCKVVFSMFWDPVVFFEAQGYEVGYDTFLEQAITLTGQANNAQATTIKGYLNQCWPSVAGPILETLRTLNENAAGENKSTTLRLSCMKKGPQTTILAKGNLESVAEVGEALSWLGSALRSSPSDNRLSSCRPSITSRRNQSSQLVWDIAFETKEGSKLSGGAYPEGTCWHDLFQDPILVEGFPIPKKPSNVLGLELSLNMMSALVGSRCVTNFAGNLFIKGFSAMLVLTKRTEHICTWHLLFNSDGDHIEYDDPRVRSISPLKTDSIVVRKLELARHVVGWCSNIQMLTGSPMATYDIRLTKLPKTKPGFAFDKVSISGGKFISGGLSFSIGKKDKPVHIKARDDYVMQLRWIAKKYVVLYDVNERRAWLVDGVSALLHLVRASLKQEQGDDFSDYFLFNPDQLKEADASRVGKSAAIYVLTTAMNQKLPLHKNADDEYEETTAEKGEEQNKTSTSAKTKSTYYRFRNRVEEIYRLLEQIISYQSQASSEDGIAFKVRSSPREQLEGFDFMDVATDEDPFWPRVTTLRSTGKGWVDFVRDIQAITLFGKGFGELLRPLPGSPACPHWTEVPKGMDHLAASVSDLKDILDKHGSVTAGLWQLVDKIYWYSPDRLFEPCQCKENPAQKPCDRVQVLLPARSLRRLTKNWKSPMALGDQGAVIFGHSRTIPLKWTDRGEVKEGDPEDLSQSLGDINLGSGSSSLHVSEKNLPLDSTPAASSSKASQTLPSSKSSIPATGKRLRQQLNVFQHKEKMRK